MYHSLLSDDVIPSLDGNLTAALEAQSLINVQERQSYIKNVNKHTNRYQTFTCFLFL